MSARDFVLGVAFASCESTWLLINGLRHHDLLAAASVLAAFVFAILGAVVVEEWVQP